MESALSLRSLTKRFVSAYDTNDTTLAVDGVDLDVKDNEFLVVVGPSGCGKSTILRLIAGLETPTSGEIYVAGERVDGLPAHSRNIGFMFQGYALFRHKTVVDNIGFGLKISKTPKVERQRRIGELIALMGLEDCKPDQLSGGQQQRVALARALAPRPRVLLLDEPFGAVDPKVRQRLRADTKGWQREMGIPTIMVTHDQREALEMGDRVAVMNQGRVEQIDTPQNVCDRPATEFAGRFIGRVNVPSAGTGQNWGRLMKDTRFEIMARPEDISISPWERKQPLGDGQIPGTIVDYAFLRRTVRLEVEVRTGRVLTIDLPKHDAVVNDLKPGTSVALAVGPCQEFPVYSRSLNGSRNTARGVGSAESE